MRIIIQRVESAQVFVARESVGSIAKGLLLYVCVEHGDDTSLIPKIVSKITHLRLFPDDGGKMNLSIIDIKGELLVVSQFTLCADLRRGNRPSFDNACAPEKAKAIYEELCQSLSGVVHTQTGVFGASMEVVSTNSGPVTFLYEG